MSTGKIPHFFYGWKIVALVVYFLIFTSGVHFFVFPVYFPELVSYFETTTTVLMLYVPIGQLFFGLFSPILGRLMGREGVKKVFVAGIFLAIVSNLLFSFATEVWHLYLFAVFNGVTMAATTFLPSQTLISLWFNRKRGVAMGIGMVGLGIGGFIFPQLAAMILTSLTDRIQASQEPTLLLKVLTAQGEALDAWRGPVRLSAFAYLFLLLPPVLYWMKNTPEEVGESVDGEVSVDKEDVEETHLTLSSALKGVSFWLLFASLLLQIFFVSGLELNLPNFATKEGGYDLLDASQFVAFSLLVSIPMRFLVGYFCDRFNPKWILVLSGLGYGICAAMLLFLILENGWRGDQPIYLFALIFGSAMAGNEVAYPIYIGRCFGSLYFSEIMGQLMIGAAVGAFFGPVTISFIHDMQGSYETSLWTLVAVGGFSTAVVLPIQVKKFLR